MEFKSSKLYTRLIEEGKLSQNALDFMDACTDDWQTDIISCYSSDGKDCDYEIRYIREGWHHDDEAKLTSIHEGDFTAMCALIEHEAECNRISLEFGRQRWLMEQMILRLIPDPKDTKKILLHIGFFEDELKEMGVIE